MADFDVSGPDPKPADEPGEGEHENGEGAHEGEGEHQGGEGQQGEGDAA